MYEKVILIDGAGWGDLILGVVVGALNLNLPDPIYMERRIPISSFQSPSFEDKKYLDYAVRIANQIVEVMQPDMDTIFKVRSGYVLSRIRKHLRERGFRVEEVETTGELQRKVARGYVRWCREMGVPAERLKDKGHFWTLLEWGSRSPTFRERLVRMGWASWEERWREKAFMRGDIAC
ncbi:MAG: hypothetical protein JSV51_03205 [Candidatus Bathyarchaeota archaeon]|nr:MAG: hypothetical protein JSV51_03205 [Candidatus Bathyarchaeota archaeon]